MLGKGSIGKIAVSLCPERAGGFSQIFVGIILRELGPLVVHMGYAALRDPRGRAQGGKGAKFEYLLV